LEIGSLNGILVIDKPAGITSAGAVAVIKRAFKARKVGHAGTLDPFATGVLVCCLNQATRLALFFLKGEKKYRAEMLLGIETDTLDATGRVVAACSDVDFTEEEIQSVFKRFQGNILQRPPAFSALKHQGVPLHKLARQGNPVQKPEREIRISSLEILEIRQPVVRFEVACSGGTYVRSLCADIGSALRCGAHLRSLRRIESSGFKESESVPLSDVETLARDGKIVGRIIPMADALRRVPPYVADSDLIEKIQHGRKLSSKDFFSGPALSPISSRAVPKSGLIKIVDPGNNLCAVLDVQQDFDRYEYCCVFHVNRSQT